MDDRVRERPVRILFVDDEEHILSALRRLFLEEDYEILTARSGKEALDLLQVNEVAVIVSDQSMPGMTGAEFLEQARRLSPDSGRLVLTGHADMMLAMEAINKGGAQRYILKPWNNDDLIAAVRWAVEANRLVRENRYLTELTRQQNERLKEWSAELEIHVQEQTVELTYKNRDLTELNQKLERNFREFIVTISNLMELRDNRMASHSNSVALVSAEMARKMGLEAKDVRNIAIAAQLHDIGKIGIPDAILLKEVDSLTSFETAEYRKHPVRGQASIDSCEILSEAALLVRHHHEEYGGKGFPDGLSGDDIPLGSRIIAVADTFVRLLPTHLPEKALAVIGLASGSRLDPHLFDALRTVAKERIERISSMTHTVEEELHPDDLYPGQVLSRDVHSGTGLLLVSRGVALDPRRIDSLKRYYRLDPPATGVFVLVSR
jgi:response regulator RpfG family c-di-GMP phosphodiesterase